MVKFYCNKLGRDRGKESFAKQGITAHYRSLVGQEWCEQIKRKLDEETQEVLQARSKAEVIEELADVLEAIDGLCTAYEIDKQELLRVKAEKLEKRGGFQEGFFIEYVEMEDNHPRVAHFRASPDKYPEKK